MNSEKENILSFRIVDEFKEKLRSMSLTTLLALKDKLINEHNAMSVAGLMINYEISFKKKFTKDPPSKPGWYAAILNKETDVAVWYFDGTMMKRGETELSLSYFKWFGESNGELPEEINPERSATVPTVERSDP